MPDEVPGTIPDESLDARVEARLTELEIRTAFQDDTIAQLNDAIVAQQRRIDLLESRIARVLESVQTLQSAQPVIDDEPPPHY